jgi:hypothetical protein
MNRSAEQKASAMTSRQALLFVVYYTAFQLILVTIAGVVLHQLMGLHVTWKGLFLAFILLACCAPIFVALTYWFRASRNHPGPFAIRFGLSMCAMVILYASVVILSARGLGLSLGSPAALPGYIVTAVVFGVPIFSLTAYLLCRLRTDSSRHDSS